MKKIFLLLFFSVALLSSCDLKTSSNDRLDGYWQLCSVDTLATGNSVDMRNTPVFWAFQYDLMMTYGQGEFVYSFKWIEDELLVYAPHYSNREQGDPVVDDVEVLRAVGINKLEERFTFVRLKGDRMILESDMLRLHFRRY